MLHDMKWTNANNINGCRRRYRMSRELIKVEHKDLRNIYESSQSLR